MVDWHFYMNTEVVARRCLMMGLSVPNMIMLDINDRETLARHPITRERTEEISHRDL